MARGLPAYKKIIIGFSRSRSPFAILSKIIGWAERRPYSHAYLRITEPVTTEQLVFQAAHGYVNFFYHKNFIDRNLVIEEYEIDINSSQFYEIWAYCVRKMGSDYGWLDLFHIGIAKLFKIRSWFSDGDKTNICSELAARIAVMSGIKIEVNIDSITPSELNKIMQKCLEMKNVRLIEGVQS